jgi:hypothetical protein
VDFAVNALCFCSAIIPDGISAFFIIKLKSERTFLFLSLDFLSFLLSVLLFAIINELMLMHHELAAP